MWSLLLQDKWGFDWIKAIHRQYAALPDSQLPQTEDDKIQQWVTRMCGLTGTNLAPFFKAWGFRSLSAATVAKCAAYPTWKNPPVPLS